MKVLFIGSKHFDYVQDLTYAGLIKTLGIKNVVQNTWNPKYYINYKQYPKNLGYQQSGIAKSLLRRKSGVDLVVVATNKADAIKQYLKLAPSIPTKTKVVFIDGGDRPELGGDILRTANEELHHAFFAARKFDYIFKREYLLDTIHAPNVHPFPISFNLDKLPLSLPSPKKYDVAFWAGSGSHAIRAKAFDVLENQFDCKANGTVKNKTMNTFDRKGDFYFEELSATRISLNFRGGGWDTLRYWEVPAVGGFMLSQKLGFHIPNNFKEGEHIAYCHDDLSDLVDLCQYYLKHENKREDMAKKAKLHLHTFHTDIARAKYLIDVCTASRLKTYTPNTD